MRNLRSASFSSQYGASQPQAQLSSLLSSSGAGANYPQPELSDTISVVSSLLTDEYKPFKPTNKAPLNQSVATASADQIDSSFSENDRREMENLRAIIKEYKAKKLVLDYEIGQKENNIKTLKENNTELKSEADESFAVWNLTRQDTLDFISEDITASYDFGDLSLSEEDRAAVVIFLIQSNICSLFDADKNNVLSAVTTLKVLGLELPFSGASPTCVDLVIGKLLMALVCSSSL
ncbi:predicted protein [Naegleria gruberi]|uniref:Predicted protein n=1 Tax=Naegleria gruberi TaxID=5762 RepID=D2W609_NAEGR|nr:uncharacterized protein NAEGRDRAFT_76852 [Naegleria gruberi]EFC35494.1 predicted protein [Naegleria gruberi]|eukprot:XP_002668238.1 predicted protein [Naegleria gruberi strain NEG-M]